jgi:ATP-dependent DNA helicase RecG
MRRGNVSHRRNPLIADLFRRIEMVEAWGRGMPLILANAPDVEFREIARLFVASFERPSAALEASKTTKQTTKETTKETTRETAKETTSERPVRMKEKLLLLIQQQPEITAAALSAATGIGVDGVNYHLNQLKQAGKLRRVGSTKSGLWQVLDTIKKEKP